MKTKSAAELSRRAVSEEARSPSPSESAPEIHEAEKDDSAGQEVDRIPRICGEDMVCSASILIYSTSDAHTWACPRTDR